MEHTMIANPFVFKIIDGRISYPFMDEWASCRDYILKINEKYILARHPARKQATGCIAEYFPVSYIIYEIIGDTLRSRWELEYCRKTMKEAKKKAFQEWSKITEQKMEV
jgi:hypothetical protein